MKLLDYQAQRTALEANRNPFATVVLAHLTAQETRQDMLARSRAKLALTRRLYDLGYKREAIINLFHCIDWLMRLPGEVLRSRRSHTVCAAQVSPFSSPLRQRPHSRRARW